MSLLRKVLGLTRKDHMRNVDILKELAFDNVIVEVLWTRFGHIIRMGWHRYPHVILHGYVHGNRHRCWPRKRWTDDIKNECDKLQLSLPGAKRLAQHRTGWRSLLGNYKVGAACSSVVIHHRSRIMSS